VKALPADLAAVCRRMRAETSVALAVHEKPDLDALGAAAGMLDLFGQLGAEAHVYVAEGEVLPLEAFVLPGDSVVRGLPPAGTSLYALDCGAFPRLALPLERWDGPLTDIDHHHDNTRYGDLVLIRPEASSTSEIVCELAHGLDLAPGAQAAASLYAGISFDSGHFHHNSTSALTFACAAWLRELGVDVTAVYGLLYESRSLGALRLCARAVEGAVVVTDGRGLVALVDCHDYVATGAAEDETEGIVETLRAAKGVEVVALVKEQSSGARVRVSLRSSAVDVSAIAAARGGGGHRLAAGFSSDDSPEEVSVWLSSELAKSLSTASS
jgi:bifunctional oligoribonuclease and PAP phosphatase NrnA